jgi:ketosteroid isomerase-like protein
VVVVTGRLVGRAAGGEVGVPVVQVWELRGGKVVRVESHNDSGAVLRAISS